MIYSYSRLKKYDDCPWAFHQKYVREIPEPPAEPLVLGKSVHQAIELALAGIPLDEAVATASTEAELPISSDEVYHLALPALEYLMAGNFTPPYRVEEHFEVPLDGPGSPVLQGYIDFWDGKGTLIDWKTNRVFYHPLDNHQLGLYAYALKDMGYSEVTGQLYFLRYRQASEPVRYTAELIDAARGWALALAKDIEERLVACELDGEDPVKMFPPKPQSGGCRYCSYAATCPSAENSPAGPTISMQEAIATAEEAAAVAAEIERLENILDGLKAQLKEWVTANGPVAVGDRVWDNYPSECWKFTPEGLKDLVTAIEAQGKDPFAYLTLGTEGRKKLGWSEEELLKYGTKTLHYSFRAKKAGNGKKR
ncbi:PD-(D/E)XK nuclease family protein [Moorellaceae bacterium AZ2]